MKQKIIPIVSVLVGILAFWLTGSYLRSERNALAREREQLYAGAKKIDIVVAVSDIPAGTAIRKEDLGFDPVIETTVPPDVVTREEWQQIVGKKLLFGIGKNRAILWGNVEGSEKIADSSLAGIIRPGMRAMSIAISGAGAVSSMIQPNDRIDILGTFAFPSKGSPGEMETATMTLLQDVTVLATGQTLAKQFYAKRKSGGASYSTITLEVTPREAETLVFAQQMKGSLFMALRNSQDVSFEKDIPEVNFRYLETTLKELNLYRQKTIRHKANP